ncbi:MAG: ATP-binding protein [Planctomycetota bacterium]
MSTKPNPLKFKVAPHIVEDLGLNLYTSLPRVLAEFVANAHDADSPFAKITMDIDAIKQARARLRQSYNEEVAASGDAAEPLERRVLPNTLTITIEDAGVGMSREELGTKFLVAGRRRRAEDEKPHTEGGRLVMGRKGLGKLAGFGVARRVTLVTRRSGESHATRIVLHYDELIAKKSTDEVEITDDVLDDGGGFATSGTRITLSELMHDPVKSREATIFQELSDHFALVGQDDFRIELNGKEIERPKPEFAYEYPKPEQKGGLVTHSYQFGTSTISFRYRMRFTKPKEALPAAKRGVRVYARGRLASAPSLLGADTNMHGFRMTDYLDGIVEADFLDDYSTDYIATDRHSLRWDAPLLEELNKFLSDEIRAACNEYQKERDGATQSIVRKDEFTKETIKKALLSDRDQTLAFKIATHLAGAYKQGVDDPQYRSKFPTIVQGIGQGQLIAAMAKLAAEPNPILDQVVTRVIELSHEEITAATTFAKGRIDAILALQKIVQDQEFKQKNEEKKVQTLMESAPWLIDATFGPVLSADESMSSLFDRLAKDLRIGRHAPPNSENSNERPDLVFFVTSESAGKLVIVELKAANASLDSTHLDQLLAYMEQADEWLRAHQPQRAFVIHGQLIGSIDTKSRGRAQLALKKRMKERGPEASWRVRDLVELLSDAEAAHKELLVTHKKK